ncbi:MAG TPA: hypothetical protein PLV25_02060 [Opitutales bacterium]|nr:hypothetical protein [Opitutales bacterium]
MAILSTLDFRLRLSSPSVLAVFLPGDDVGVDDGVPVASNTTEPAAPAVPQGHPPSLHRLTLSNMVDAFECAAWDLTHAHEILLCRDL